MTDETIDVIDYYNDWKSALSLQKHELVKASTGHTSVYVNLSNVPNKLFDHVYTKPEDSIKIIKEVLIKEFNIKSNPYIRFTNFPKLTEIRDLRSSKLNRFTAIHGIVRSISPVQPWVINGVFQCKGCHTRIRERQDTFRISFPSQCICGRSSWEFIPEDSNTIDYQMMVIQENPEWLKGGEVPAEIDVRVTGDIVGKVTAGQRVIVYGVLKTVPVKRNQLHLKTIFDVNNIEIIKQDYSEIVITENDEKRIKELAQSPSLFAELVGLVAPSIYGNDILKKAILLQLFGGVRHKNSDGTYNRGDIHILVVGDPGVAKSKLLSSVVSLCPRAIKATGGGSTKAGLTACAVQDGLGNWMLEAGAVVLADQGHLILDEIDKMNNEDRAAIHEAMEQQVVSVAKAGINTTLQARCSILAAANPKSGRFDSFTDLAQQIDMPPTLLSRFDLIFTMTDKPDKNTDGDLASFLLSRCGNAEDKSLDIEFIRKYIAYAKKNVFPKMSLSAHTILKDYYVNVRSLSAGKSKAIPITPRQLEALIRLSEASARLRLSEIVDSGDAELAVNIIDQCLKYLAYDPITGQLDIDRVTNKMSTQTRDMAKIITDTINALKDPEFGDAKKSDVINELVSHGFDRVKVERGIESMISSGDLMYTGSRYEKIRFT